MSFLILEELKIAAVSASCLYSACQQRYWRFFSSFHITSTFLIYEYLAIPCNYFFSLDLYIILPHIYVSNIQSWQRDIQAQRSLLRIFGHQCFRGYQLGSHFVDWFVTMAIFFSAILIIEGTHVSLEYFFAHNYLGESWFQLCSHTKIKELSKFRKNVATDGILMEIVPKIGLLIYFK